MSRIESPGSSSRRSSGIGSTMRSGGRQGERRAGILQRQIEGERAADAGRGAQLDFAAEQAREFAADGEAETGAAVFAAGGGVGLLERLEDDLLLLGRDADAAVRHLEGDYARRLPQHRMVRIPAAARTRDAQLH